MNILLLLGVVNVVGIAAERLNLINEKSSSLLENISFVKLVTHHSATSAMGIRDLGS